MFHKNGKVKLHEYQHPLSPDVNIIEEYDSQGRLRQNWYVESKYKTLTEITYNDKKMIVDNYLRGAVIAPSANYPINKQLKSHYKGKYNSYEGYLTAGAYSFGDKYQLTGYFSPIFKINGNGSVLFAENLDTKECWWVAIVNGKIVYAIPAKTTDKPDIDKLNNVPKSYVSAIQVEKPETNAFRKSNNMLTFQNPYDNYSRDNFYRFTKREVSDVNTYSFATVTTPNFDSHSGYGISMTSKDSIIPAQIRYLTVGNLLNGKLNGMGYRCKLTYVVHDNSVQFYKSDINIIGLKVEAAVGEFKNGDLIKGFTINEVDFDGKNIWEEITIDGLTYKSPYNEKRSYAEVTESRYVTFSSIFPGDEIYLEAVNRKFKIKGIDREKKELIIDSDTPGKTIRINQNSGKSFGVISRISNQKVSCPTTSIEYIYEKVTVVIKTYNRSYVGSTSYVKGGIRYTYPKQPDYESSHTEYETRVKGQKTVVCKACGGTGQKSAGKNERIAYIINFNK